MTLTTPEMIREWFNRGIELGATHLIVACDTFDYEDYPVYVKLVPKQEPESPEDSHEQVRLVHDVRKLVSEDFSNGTNMQKAMEVYKLSDPMEEQIAVAYPDRNFRY